MRDVCGRAKLRQYLHIYLWSTIPRTPRNDAGALSAAMRGKRQGPSETMKALETAGEGKGALAGIVLCPEEISEWKQRSYSRRPTAPAASSGHPVPRGVAEPSALQSYLICISLLYTFFLLISAPSLCSEARQKEEKHSTRADISLYVHLTYKNFNSENNSCRLLNTASDG